MAVTDRFLLPHGAEVKPPESMQNVPSIERDVLILGSMNCGLGRPCPECQADPSELVDYKNETHLLTTPQDELTGVVLLLHPDGASKEVHTYAADDHHPEHPERHSLLGDVGGLAVRKSRVQRANYYLHHIDNHQTFRGPVLPSTEKDQFKRVVLNTGGFIPELGIAFKRPGEYYLKPIAEAERRRIWRSNLVRVDNPTIVNDFIKKYLFEQEMGGIKEWEIEQFLGMHDPIRRWKMAKRILDEAAIEATDGMDGLFKRLYESRLMPPRNSWRVAKFVVHNLANHEGQKSILSRQLQDSLKERAEAA